MKLFWIMAALPCLAAVLATWLARGARTRNLDVTSRNGGAGGVSATRYLNLKTGTWTLTPPPQMAGEFVGTLDHVPSTKYPSNGGGAGGAVDPQR